MRERAAVKAFILRHKQVIPVCLLILLLGVSASSQNNKESDFTLVPTPMRTQFIERLNMLVQAMRTQKYECAYELLSEEYAKGESKEAFVKRLKQFYSGGDRIINFVPESVSSNAEEEKEPTAFIVAGCLELYEKKRKIKVDASVQVFVKDGSLYFSQLGPLRTLDGKYLPCK
jgi:hypothetical protein